LQLTAVISTLSLLFAQRFLPQNLWTPVFSLIAAVTDTTINVGEKKRAIMEEERRRLKREAEGKKE
jgi:hypothetical protein